MAKTLTIICESKMCNGSKREYEYDGDQNYLNGVKLFEWFTCPVCHYSKAFHITDAYIKLIETKK